MQHALPGPVTAAQSDPVIGECFSSTIKKSGGAIVCHKSINQRTLFAATPLSLGKKGHYWTHKPQRSTKAVNAKNSLPDLQNAWPDLVISTGMAAGLCELHACTDLVEACSAHKSLGAMLGCVMA